MKIDKIVKSMSAESVMTSSLAISTQSSAAIELRNRFKDAAEFLVAYNPAKQVSHVRDIAKVYTGDAPSINLLTEAFGEKVPEVWLEAQLKDLSEFSGARDKMTVEQIEGTARVIAYAYGHLKISELMLFFLKFKCGDFGKFYGSVDGLAITEALKTFTKNRIEIKGKYEQLERERREEEERRAHREEVEKFAKFRKYFGMSMHEFFYLKNIGVKNIYDIIDFLWVFRCSYIIGNIVKLLFGDWRDDSEIKSECLIKNFVRS